MKFVFFACLLFPALMLVGCGERELVAGLDERQSIEAILALHRAGVSSVREVDASGRGHTYRILTPGESFVKGLAVISEYGFPRKGEDSLSDLVQTSALLPPSKEISQLRVDRALSLQVERVLAALPGVVDVRVVLRGNGGSFAVGDITGSSIKKISEDKEISAVVVLRYIERNFEEERVRTIVTQSVRGISRDRIEIHSFPVLLPSADMPIGLDEKGAIVTLVKLNMFSFRVPEEDLAMARGVLTTMVVVFGFCTFVVGLVVGSSYLSHTRFSRSEYFKKRASTQESSLVLAQKVAMLRRGYED